MKEFIWKKSGKVKNLYGNVKKNEKLYGKMLNSTWQKYGKVKNVYGNVKDL